jgi:proteic killer suppression protein
MLGFIQCWVDIFGLYKDCSAIPSYPLTFNAMRHIISFMIQSFKCRETEKIFNRHFSKKFPNDIHRPALRKLRMLNRARTLRDLLVPPGNRLESLRGKREGQHSIRINDQWRICFEWHNNDAYVVEITDYH